MRKAKRFSSREKQVFLVGFSLTFPRSPRISKNRLNTSLVGMTISTNVDSSNDQTYVGFEKCNYVCLQRTLEIGLKWI